MKYKAYLVEEIDGVFEGSVQELELPVLENRMVTIKVHYSSLNYKDALASTGVKGVVREYPFVPGIDVAGEVIESNDDKFNVGDLVIASGYKIGMAFYGGFGEMVQLPNEFIVNLPDGLSLKQSMQIGTAGLTAAASVKKIIDSGLSNNLPVLVSGATGGVGSVAVNLLSNLGYEVHALTGKSEEVQTLKDMGASEVVLREDFMADPIKALDKGIYGGAVDTVGGDILAKIISMVSNEGSVSCCGNVAGMKFTSSVFPFILRGVSLIGIDNAESPLEFKKKIWQLLSNDWSLDLNKYSKTISLNEVRDEITKILNGQQVGRVVIKHGA